MTANAELLPCPFCGATEESEDPVDRNGWLDDKGNEGPECLSCGATAKTIEAWNTRAPAEHGELVDPSPILKALIKMKEASDSAGDKATLYNAIVAIETQYQINEYQKAQLSALSTEITATSRGVTISKKLLGKILYGEYGAKETGEIQELYEQACSLEIQPPAHDLVEVGLDLLQPLFNFFSENHGINLTEGDMHDIIHEVSALSTEPDRLSKERITEALCLAAAFSGDPSIPIVERSKFKRIADTLCPDGQALEVQGE